MSDLRNHKRSVRTPHRRRVVGVIGSGVTSDPCAAQLGEMLAQLDCDLLTGGGRGMMAAVCRAFFEVPDRQGLVIGIIPGRVPQLDDLEHQDAVESVDYEVESGYPNQWIELAIYTHLPDSGRHGTLRSSRNHVNVLSSDVLVALPGREGTYTEMWLALHYGVPTIAFGPHELVPPGVPVTDDLDEVRHFVLAHLD